MQSKTNTNLQAEDQRAPSENKQNLHIPPHKFEVDSYLSGSDQKASNVSSDSKSGGDSLEEDRIKHLSDGESKLKSSSDKRSQTPQKNNKNELQYLVINMSTPNGEYK